MMSDDLIIFYAPDGKVWAEYLGNKFSSEVYNITTVLKEFNDADHTSQAKVNVFMITPDLTELDDWSVLEHFDSATSVAVLTGITHDDWYFVLEKFNIDSLEKWIPYELIAEETSVRNLIMYIIELYENKLCSTSPNPSDIVDDGNKGDLEEEEIYINIKDLKTEVIPLPKKQRSNSEENLLRLGPNATIVNSTSVPDEVNNNVERAKSTGEEDDIYKTFTCSRPVNTVSHVFRKGDYVYLLLEGINSGHVQAKFYEDGKTVSAACESDRAMLYSFKHDGTEDKTFDVTLDGIEIGYGIIEPIEKPKSEIPEEFFDFPPQVPDRSSLISSSSTSSSVSSHSSNTNSHNRGPPPCHTPSNTKYINVDGRSSVKLRSGVSESPDVSFSISSQSQSPSSQTDSCYVSPDSWTSPLNSPSDTSSTGTIISSKLDQIQRLLEGATDPVSILCQSLHAENDRQLDDRMTAMLQPTEVLKNISRKPSRNSFSGNSDLICPTLMHFGARYNLKNFCLSLWENPITCEAVLQRDRDGFCPHEIARRVGNRDLADILERFFKDMLRRSDDSGISHITSTDSTYMDMSANPISPPALYDRTQSMKNQSSNKDGVSKIRNRSILKKTSQDSMTAEDQEDYENVHGLKKQDSSSSVGSMSQGANALRVTLGPCTVIDDEKTPVPESPMTDPFSEGSSKETNGENRLSGEFERSDSVKSANRKISEDERTHRKDIRTYYGITTSQSASNVHHLHHAKKQGWKIFGGKKDKTRAKSDPRIQTEEMQAINVHPHTGMKTKVHKVKELHIEDIAVFRDRLQTHPAREQIKRPESKRYAEEKVLSSSVSDLTRKAGGHVKRLPTAKPSPLCMQSHVETPSPHFQRSVQHLVKIPQHKQHGSREAAYQQDVKPTKDTEVLKRGKEKNAIKTENKQKLQLTINNAAKRISMRLHHAKNDQLFTAPPLPARSGRHMNPLGSL